MTKTRKKKSITVTVNKKRQWRKGQSCVSNPTLKKYRQDAKNRFFNVISGPSNLTLGAIAKHDHDTFEDDVSLRSEEVSDIQSLCAKSTSTWASHWTDCTNPAFSKVYNFKNASSSLQKSILAVLAAITEIIKSGGGKETDTEYFGALMAALENETEEDSVAAITYLLSLAMKRTPVAVLKTKLSDVSKVLIGVLAKHMNAGMSTILSNTLKCIAYLLKAQEQVSWSSSSTGSVFNSVLTFSVHAKPKVRKAAHQAIISILKDSQLMLGDNAPRNHPAGTATAKFCINQIESCGGAGETSIILHTLGLLQEVLAVLQPNAVKSVCETILKIITLSNVQITSTSMKCLYKMFSDRPKTTSLSPELNAQIIVALYDFQPAENDTQLMSIWLSVMTEAHINLAMISESLFISHIPKYFITSMHCLKNATKSTAKVATGGLSSLLKDSLAPLADKLGSKLASAASDTQLPVQRIVKSIENGLSYQYHDKWDLVLELIAVLFTSLGKPCSSILLKCLHTLAELRENPGFQFKAELDRVVGLAIRTIGPQKVLAAIPLQISGDSDNYDFPRSWLIPLLGDNIRETELSFFIVFFLPLAATFRNKALENAKQGYVLEAKTYDTLQLQIWSLLPGFCTQPTDLAKSFKGLAKVLGVGLRDREDIRMDIMSGLRKLIAHSIDHDEDRAELSKFAKNFLPLLFNLFTTEPEKDKDPVRLTVLETTRVYIKIAPKLENVKYVNMCLEKLGDPDCPTFRRHALLDLLIILAPTCEEDCLAKIHLHVLEELKIKDRTVQKKSYRILEEICKCASVCCRQFVASHLKELQEILVSSVAVSTPCAKTPRLKCLIHIFKQLQEQKMDLLLSVLSEAVLCTNESAEKSRQAAHNLLAELVGALFRWNPTSPKTAIVQMFFEFILAGLAGKPHVISCTTLALSRLTSDFKDYITDDLLTILVESTCLLLASKSREVATSALGLLKVLISSFDDVTIGQFLPNIVSSLVSVKEENKQPLRFKAKEIFTKLIKKFGYSIIISQVPKSYHKMLTHIQKTEKRAKKKKKPQVEDEHEDQEGSVVSKNKPENFEDFLADSDLELEEMSSQKKEKKRGQRTATWLKEDGEDDAVVNFLDPSMSKKIMATKPQTASKQGKPAASKKDFQTAPDGRMIINEDIDEEEDDLHGKGVKAAPIDDLDELLDAFEGPGRNKRKRKQTGNVDDDDADDEQPMKYRAGGSGIHRRLNKGRPGEEFKAKKAGGDIKKKGKHDPFAYMPLTASNLNKRKRAKSSGQFNNLLKSAKKGAAKGRRLKNAKK